MYQCTPFVDRNEAFKDFDEILDTGVKVIIVHSKEGLGKTRFIKEYFKSNYDVISLDTSITNKTMISPYYFFDTFVEMFIKQHAIKLESLNFEISTPTVIPLSVSMTFASEKSILNNLKKVKKKLSSITYKTIVHISEAQYIDADSFALFISIMKDVDNIIFLMEIAAFN